MRRRSGRTNHKHQRAQVHQKDNAAAGNDRGSFWRFYLPSSWRLRKIVASPLFLVLTISTVVAWFKDYRVVAETETWSLDLFLKRISRTVTFDDVYIVHIADADYRDKHLFNSQSPLDPTLVLELVSAVSSLGPKVVGVDLDTKDSAWYSAMGASCRAEHVTLLESSPVIVWARMPVESKNQQASSRDERPIQLYQLLGGFKDCQKALSGVPRFPFDTDGVVRKYIGEFVLDDGAQKRSFTPSFARVIAEQYGGVYQKSSRERILNFAPANPVITAGQLCAIAGRGEKCLRSNRENGNQEVQKWKNQVAGQIVLIGGAFEDARDTYPTPVGQVQGVGLNALAIESDLHHGAIYETPLVCDLFCDLLAGTLVVWVFWFFASPTLALALGTFGVGAVSLLVSWLLLHCLTVWLSFIPVLVGVNIHQYYEHLRQTRKAAKRVGGKKEVG